MPAGVAYERGGKDIPPTPGQRRFCDPSVEAYLERLDAMRVWQEGTGSIADIDTAMMNVPLLNKFYGAIKQVNEATEVILYVYSPVPMEGTFYEAARAEGIDASGPHPADTVFFQAVHRGRYDAIVCMYHDQGHGPMKLLAFDSGVNVTLGLPIVRTSVDHGTAFDIAWKGVAFTDSLVHALGFARLLVGD